MSNYIPLYTNSITEARAQGELDLWRESYRENIRCKEAIEEAVRKNFDGWHLKQDCTEKVIEAFGADRVAYVLASTLQQMNYDGRFMQSNKDWGNSYPIPSDETNLSFRVNSHPAVLDGFIQIFRSKLEQGHDMDTPWGQDISSTQ